MTQRYKEIYLMHESQRACSINPETETNVGVFLNVVNVSPLLSLNPTWMSQWNTQFL